MKRFDIGVIILLMAVNIAAYGNSFSNEFVWDDRPLIVSDYHLRSVRHLGDIFTRDFFSHSEEEIKYGYYRPLITASYLTDLYFWGLNPFGFHLTNLLVHIVVCWLLYIVGRCLFPSFQSVAVVAALLFTLHPVHTESVTWIAGRTDVICTFFFLLSFWFYLRGERSHLRIHVTFSCINFLLALLAKEMALILPLILLFYELLLNKRSLVISLKKTLPAWSIVGFYLFWRFFIARVEPGPKGEETLFVLGLSSMKTFWLYLAKLIFPADPNAYIQNAYLIDLYNLTALIIGSLTLLLIFFLIRLRGGRPVLFFLALAFLISLLPLSNLIRISAPFDMGFPMAERFLYLPSAFFLLFIAALAARREKPSLLVPIVVVILLFGGILISQRNQDWRNEETFFRAALEKSPRAPLLLLNLGRYYCREGLTGEGIANLKKAEKIDRTFYGKPNPNYLNDLAVAYRLAGKAEEALRVLRTAASAGKPLSSLEYNRGMLFLQQNRLPEARRAFGRALKLRPSSLDAMIGLARVYQAEGKYEDARRSYQEALALYPDSAEIHNRLGVLYRETGRYREAVDEYSLALALDPGHTISRSNRGIACALLGNHAAARDDLEATIVAGQDTLETRNALGMVYAELGMEAEAEEMFASVLERDPENPEALLNWGILLYRQGNMEGARKNFEAVLKAEPAHSRARRYLSELEAAN